MLVCHILTSVIQSGAVPRTVTGYEHVHFGASAIDGRSSSGCLGLVDVVVDVAVVVAVAVAVAVVAACDGSRPLGASATGVSATGSSTLLSLSKPWALALF